VSSVPASTLPIGDLGALQLLGLEAVGVVHGVSVGSLNPMREFHPGRRRLNRGPAFRPGRADAHFGFLWNKASEISIMMPATSPFYSWQQAADRLRATTFELDVPRPTWASVNGYGMRAGPGGSAYVERARAIRRWGIELQTGVSVAWIPGLVFETGENTDSFAHHFGAAHSMMRTNAALLGADGVIGVHDSVLPVQRLGASEFKMIGTAVRRVEGAHTSSQPWTTYLVGQSFVKLLEAGLMPVEIRSSYVNLVAVHTPITRWLGRGQSVASSEITEYQRFRELGYELVRERIKDSIEGDELHGVSVEQSYREAGAPVASIETWIRGTKVRRFSAGSETVAPRLTLDIG
jgi:hypothetical protein